MAEVVGGLLTGSLALLAAAGHMPSDPFQVDHVEARELLHV